MKKAINILTKNGFQVSEQWEDGAQFNKPGIKLVVNKDDSGWYTVSQYEFHNGYTTEDYFDCELEDLKDFE